MLKRGIALFLAGILTAVPVWAGNGHFLHGILPINSAMGGAGVGLPTGVVSALHGNPALITRLGYIRFETGSEFFKDKLSATTVTAGGISHTTDSDGEVGVLPGVAWVVHPHGKKFAFGWALLAAAGFRTNFPPDPNNLMLAPQPAGFGLLNTELAMTKVSFAFAYEVTPRLSLGTALVLFQGRLAVSPNPVVEPDISGSVAAGTFQAFRPVVSGPVTKIAPAVQIGAFYEFTPMVSAGASFTSSQNFDDYQWNSTHANPNNPDFMTARTVGLDIDGPPVISFGVGLNPTPKLKIALDGRWVGYKNTEGIGKAEVDIYKDTPLESGGGLTPPDGVPGFPQIPRFALVSIGWQNIWIGMAGAEYQVTPKFAVRGGLNFNQSPIKDAITLNSGGTPSVFTQHYTGGFSLGLTENFSVDVGFYYTPENSKTGPFDVLSTPPPALPSITLTDSIVSGLIGFSASF